MLRAGSHRIYLARTFGRNVDASGFFENQLDAGTWMTFDQSISGIRVQSIVTNFNGTWTHGSYIKVNGTVVASDHTLSPDGTNNSLAVGGSAQFGGNYLSLVGSADTAMGTGDFTWEAWVYLNRSDEYRCFIDTRTGPLSGGDDTGFYFGTNFDTLKPIYYTTSLQLESTVSMTLNAWNHVALTRNGGTVTLWVNGASGGTKSDTTNLTQQRVFIGGVSDGGASTGLLIDGKITNLRIVKGTALYTTTFTPSPNPLLPVNNTKLLLTELNSGALLKDTSPSNFTITNNGSVNNGPVTWNSATPFTTGVTTTAPRDANANQYGVGFRMLRGHTIVVLNPTDGTIRPGWPKTYDTYGDAGTPSCNNMATDLLAVASGDVVAIGTFDATSCNQNLRDALTNLFGDTDYTNTWSQVRISHMFLGKRKQYITGLWRSLYNGYFGEGADGGARGKQANSPTWFDTQTPTESIQVTDFSKPNIGVSLASAQWLGYFRAPHTADYTFYITSDDESYFWIGNNAVTNYTTTNADIWTWVGLGEIASNPISLEQGKYYPIRSQWGNATGLNSFSISWSNTITAKTSDFTGLLFYDTAGPGF